MKYTPWFPSGTKPARPGVYQRRMAPGTVYPLAFAMWNGKHWIAAHGSVKDASAEVVKSYYQPGRNDKSWRGIKEPT